MAGLKTPGIVFTLNTAPTSMAPVFPAEAKESMSPFLSSTNPLAMLEFGFWGSAGATAGLLAAMPLVKYVRGEVFRRILLGMIGLAGVVCLARAAAQP